MPFAPLAKLIPLQPALPQRQVLIGGWSELTRTNLKHCVLEVPSWECQRFVAIPVALLVEDSQLSRYTIKQRPPRCEAVKPSRFSHSSPPFTPMPAMSDAVSELRQ